jgi:hypothetical protein
LGLLRLGFLRLGLFHSGKVCGAKKAFFSEKQSSFFILLFSELRLSFEAETQSNLRLCRSGPNVTKLFTTVIYQKARAFVPGRPFHISLLFANKARNLPNSGSPDT